MEHTHPSTSVAALNRSSIRHRSGAFSPSLVQRPREPTHAAITTHENGPYPGPGLIVRVEDVDATHTGHSRPRPTVLLVQRPSTEAAPAVSRSPALPFHNGTVKKSTLARAREAEFAARAVAVPVLEKHDPRALLTPLTTTPEYEEGDVPVVVPFSPVPLTPRPHPPIPAPPVWGSPLVPGPGSTNSVVKEQLDPAPGPYWRSSLPSRLLSWRKPTHRHPDSEDGACKTPSAAAPVRYRQPLSSSAEAGGLGMSDKLTKKFPISASVRKLSTLGRGRVGDRALAIVLLDEAEGMGMERMERWTVHKWCLFLSVCSVFAYGAAGLLYAVLTWCKTWAHADVMHVADYDVLVLITIASALMLLTFAIGMTGTILNSRPILAVYALLLWPALVAILAVGYTAYKRSAFALDRKLNLAWSEWYTAYGRLVVQDSLRCCGYYSPLHMAAPSGRCYARAALPGCKGALLAFERANLAAVWAGAFGVVPVHVANVFVALLCANHVTRRFGKGVMPRRYRLTGEDVVQGEARLRRAMEREGAVVRPLAARAPSSSVFREDRKEDVYDGLPAALCPGVR